MINVTDAGKVIRLDEETQGCNFPLSLSHRELLHWHGGKREFDGPFCTFCTFFNFFRNESRGKEKSLLSVIFYFRFIKKQQMSHLVSELV